MMDSKSMGETDWERSNWANSLTFLELEGFERSMCLRVASLNCLAPSYCHTSQLPWVPADSLGWEVRKQTLVDAILEIDCDVLCLQECEHEDDWRSILGAAGFDVAFARRPTRKDGCLTAWRRTILEPSAPQVVLDFNTLVTSNHHKICFKRDNIATICRLQWRPNKTAPPRDVVISNTHIYWNPLKPEVKLAQVVELVHNLERMQASLGHKCGLCLCGDLNSLPSSDAIVYFLSGVIEPPVPVHHDRFLCDVSLVRLCRWLRLLGINTALESPDEHHRRT